jgi:hypothetical protein
MWDDIIIGSGTKYCSSFIFYRSVKTDISISQNKSSYWVSHCIFDKGITIYKDCREGEKLTKLLELPEDKDQTVFTPKKSKDSQIVEFLNKLVIKHLSYEAMITSIEEIRKKAFDEGQNAKAEEIRNALFL